MKAEHADMKVTSATNIEAAASNVATIYDPLNNTSEEKLLQKNHLGTAKIIIVGSGPTGMRLADEILKRAPDAHIHIFGNEPYQPYNRVQLSALLSGDVSRESIDIALPDTQHFPNFQFTIDRVSHIDSEQKAIQTANGDSYQYDKLVLATGARAHKPNIEGIDLTGVYTFRNLKDAEYLFSRKVRARHIVVVGGGLLGIESAKGLLRFGTKVTIIQQGERLMNRQLDEYASNLLEEKLAALDIRVIKNNGVRKIFGDDYGRVTSVQTRTNDEILCDSVLLCAGIKPNIELARESRIKVNTGIVVDEKLSTNTADIYAVGECCEYNGETYGLAAPGFEQASVLANQLVHQQSLYQGSLIVSRLKVLGEQVCSMGDVTNETWRAYQHTVTFKDKKNHTYRKVIVRRGKVVGAMGFGPWPEFARIQESYKTERHIWAWQLLLFRLSGELWPASDADNVADWPDTAIVCQCNNLSKGSIVDVINQPSKEKLSLKELQKCTSAGTVCGSCKPLLHQLVGEGQNTVKEEFNRTFLTTTILTLLGIFSLLSIPAFTVADSVFEQGWFEAMWNDKFWKQVTGFSLLGLSSVGLIMSLRKRLNFTWMGNFKYWRLAHISLGVICVFGLMLHTGFHFGDNLNQWLMINFIAILSLGAITSSSLGLNHTFQPLQARRIRRLTTWMHIIISWPLPALLSLHILSVYYF